MDVDQYIWGKQVIEKALEYANYKWTAHEKNVMHGIDENGRFVDTLDITWNGDILDCDWWKVGEINVVIPYGWGLPKKIATRDIPKYAIELECIDDIQQGNVFA